ncbi:hypothetical protein BDZ45DRAFT_752418 [Acephala macrosclerotiorum]|nr:hypothetical protein BDZ45DRAFT_752418 [Acephala macrosclerotiorum]
MRSRRDTLDTLESTPLGFVNKIIDPAIKARTITNVIPELAFEVNAYLLCLYHAALILLKHLFRFIEPQVSGSLQGTRQYINTLKVIPSALPQMCGGSHNVPSAELSLARLLFPTLFPHRKARKSTASPPNDRIKESDARAAPLLSWLSSAVSALVCARPAPSGALTMSTLRTDHYYDQMPKSHRVRPYYLKEEFEQQSAAVEQLARPAKETSVVRNTTNDATSRTSQSQDSPELTICSSRGNFSEYDGLPPIHAIPSFACYRYIRIQLRALQVPARSIFELPIGLGQRHQLEDTASRTA